jgi:hypothetical protein
VTIIHSLEEWNSVVNEQLERLYSTPELSAVFQKLKKILTSNGEVSRLRDIIIAHREIIPALRNIPALKVKTWLDCFSKLDMPFTDYYRNISRYTSQIKALYEQASAQSERWQDVVNEFEFSVSPNPAAYYLTIQSPNRRAESLIITNVLGQVVYSEGECDLTNKEIKLDRFENGTYFIGIISEGKQSVKQVVINK